MTRHAHAIVPLALLFAACASASPAPGVSPDGRAALEGAWTVDLSTEPGQPYAKPMHLKLAPDSATGGAVTGDFYDSEILAGRWKTDRGRTCVSFRTTDGCVTGAWKGRRGRRRGTFCLIGTRCARTSAVHPSPARGKVAAKWSDEGASRRLTAMGDGTLKQAGWAGFQ